MNIRANVGIIGGSGIYHLESLTDVRRITVTTPYGQPSGPVVVGSLAGRTVAFLARHGEKHELAPSHVPSRANIYALKALGVRTVVSVSAVGSLREEIAPGDLVVPDQIVDRTRERRGATFFDQGMVVHVPVADPYCPRSRPALVAVARSATSVLVHDGGVYCCIEGPQFSTRAESRMFRALGHDVIGMTAMPEAKLAREAELCYVGLALVTDYDCWRDGHDDVTATAVAAVMAGNATAAWATMTAFVETVDAAGEATDPAPAAGGCGCENALANAILTPLSTFPSGTDHPWERLLDRYREALR